MCCHGHDLEFLFFFVTLIRFLTFRGDNVDLSVINPRREKSGTYKVIFRNAQGQDERDINVNIMGKKLIKLCTEN